MALGDLIRSIRRQRKLSKISKKRLHLWDLPQQQICYIQNYKVATRSIRLALTRFLLEQETGVRNLDYESITDDQVEEKDDETKRFKHASEIRSVCPNHFVFTFVRHPLARLQSCYTNRLLDSTEKRDRDRFAIYGINREMNFEQFVEVIAEVPDKYLDRHVRSQHVLVRDGDHTVCDFIGKFENLAEDWQQLQDRFSFPPLPHKNKSTKRSSAEFTLSARALELVAKRYAKDFELFGYEL